MAPLSPTEVKAHEHPRLPSRYLIAIICGIILLPLFAAFALFGIITLLLVWIIALVWLLHEVAYVRMVDNSVLVSDYNYPRIHLLAEEVRASLSLRKEISIFVYEQGNFNALLVKFLWRKAIFIQSELLETGVSDDEVRWIVGRFVGYLRVHQDAGPMGKLVRLTGRTGVFTLLIYPYERAMVYTGDRLGLAAIGGDLSSAVSAMQKLLVGRQLGYSVNPLGIIDQRRKTKGSIFAFLARVSSPFPSTTARYVDLISFSQRQYPEAFARFAGTTPGLPDDLRALSGEHTSADSVGRAAGYWLAVVVAMGLTVLLWVALLDWWGGPKRDDPYDYDTLNRSSDEATNNSVAATTSTADSDQMTTDAEGATYHNVCVANRAAYKVYYEIRHGESGNWVTTALEANESKVESSTSTEKVQVRFDYTLNDKGTVYRQFDLDDYSGATATDCGTARYYFEPQSGELQLYKASS